MGSGASSSMAIVPFLKYNASDSGDETAIALFGGGDPQQAAEEDPLQQQQRLRAEAARKHAAADKRWAALQCCWGGGGGGGKRVLPPTQRIKMWAIEAGEGAGQPRGIHGDLVDWSCSGLRELTRYRLSFLTTRTSLDLSHNLIRDLPIGIGSLRALKHLNLHDCDMHESGLPKSFFSGLAALEVLNISLNYFEELSDAFGGLTALRRLIAHGNCLRRVNDGIFEAEGCAALEHIELQCNLLTGLPPGIAKLRKLAYLDVEHVSALLPSSSASRLDSHQFIINQSIN